MTIASKYSLFAILATLINLSVQEIVIRIYDGSFPIYLAMMFGTLAGLVSKYLLDKKTIFGFITTSHREDLGKFTLYGLTGVVTTAIFWGFELGFDSLIGGKIARYMGAVIGLSIGYGVKYQLDKRYVFARQA
ncbi:MAG: GtrA family protein [Gammaproteobacteria bacterium]|jgi:putative flippase GtrA|tara:strand:- start:664 stop:1062 length:399 start_codon:yes stop_codon:yes gene_type:complete